MVRFTKIVNGFSSLTIFTKRPLACNFTKSNTPSWVLFTPHIFFVQIVPNRAKPHIWKSAILFYAKCNTGLKWFKDHGHGHMMTYISW